MATTADGIIYPVAGDYIAPLNAHIQALAESTQTALDNRLGSYVSYNPTLGGITIGNGAVYAKYAKVGRLVVDEIMITFGSTTTLTGAVTINNLPIGSLGSVSSLANMPCGSAFFRKSTGGTFEGTVRIGSLNTVWVEARNASGTYVGATSLSASIPWSWSVGDQIFISMTRLASA